MLDVIRDKGAERLVGTVDSITNNGLFCLGVQTDQGMVDIHTNKVVNAAGPFADKIAAMLDIELPIYNTLQQKIAFEDHRKAIPRNMPFSIDLDAQQLDWLDDEREMIMDDPDHSWLAKPMPGAIHCRPDGGDYGTWVKLGWACNDTRASTTWERPLYDIFPNVVLRGAARLNPAIKTYYGQLPRSMHHYGGWYTMTEENWPSIDPMGSEGAFMNCAHSGFGTMAACAGGELCAAWVAEGKLPQYATEFSLERYHDSDLMRVLQAGAKGVL